MHVFDSAVVMLLGHAPGLEPRAPVGTSVDGFAVGVAGLASGPLPLRAAGTVVVLLIQVARVAAQHVPHHVRQTVAVGGFQQPAGLVFAKAVSVDADAVAQGTKVQQAGGNRAVFFVKVDRLMLVALLGNQVEASGDDVAGCSCHGKERRT
jgi:hypothetical protein